MADNHSSPPSLTALAFDFGTQWIGVAVGQTVTASATPLHALKARDGIPDWDTVQQLVAEWRPGILVVGLPLNMDGSESELSTRARKFANRLHGRTGLAVELVDERLSSFEAKGDIIRETGSRQFKREGVDSRAAQVILEDWLRMNSHS